METKKTFGDRIKILRAEKKLSQQMLADMLNITCAGISLWESDKRMPKADMVLRLADVLEVQVTELLDVTPAEERAILIAKQILSYLECEKEKIICGEHSDIPLNIIDERIFQMKNLLNEIMAPALSRKLQDFPRNGITIQNETIRKADARLRADDMKEVAPLWDELYTLLHQRPDTDSRLDRIAEQKKILEQMRSLVNQMSACVTDEKDSEALLAAYKKLNAEGRAELLRRAEEMAYIPKYTAD